MHLIEFLVHFSGPPILVEHVEVACQIPQAANSADPIFVHPLHRQVLFLDGPGFKLFKEEFFLNDLLNGEKLKFISASIFHCAICL